MRSLRYFGKMRARRHQEVISEGLRLAPGERVHLTVHPSRLWTAPLYPLTLGLWALFRRRQSATVTNQRVIVRSGLPGSRVERSIPLARVQDVTLSTTLNTGATVSLSSAGGLNGNERIARLSHGDAQRFTDALRDAMSSTST